MNEDAIELFCSCVPGTERATGEELRALGAERVRPLTGGVSFFGEAPTALRVCLWSRLAGRVTHVAERVDARDAEALYTGLHGIAWERLVAPGASIAVRARGVNEQLRNTHFTELKAKDAVCDRLREARGLRPDVDTEAPDALIEVRLREKRATVSIELSGETLHRRGYLLDSDGDEAALLCAQAAGLLSLCGWDGADETGALVDPSCGEGMVVLEAALAACDGAPGLTRERWGFFGWSLFDEQAWRLLLDEADGRLERGLEALSSRDEGDAASVRFRGFSASSPAVSRARARARRAGLSRVVSFEHDEGAAAAVAAQGLGDAGRRVLIAMQQPRRDAASRAVELAAASAFADASRAAGERGRFAVAGCAPAEALFDAPVIEATLGAGRAEAHVAVFERPPAQPHELLVPDTAGGAEHRVEVLEEGTAQFAARLFKNCRDRRKWARREGVGCYRLYDADLPDYAVAIDVYEGAGDNAQTLYLHVAEYAPPASVDPARARRRLADVLAVSAEVMGVRPEHVFVKTRVRDSGGSQYAAAGASSYVCTVEEGGHLFEVDLSGHLDTGLFLDHRPLRRRIGQDAAGKRFLNLFAYTGAASVYAAGAGAAETCTVDLSQNYLDWARRNMALNGFTGPEHSFERADACSWITACRRSPRRFDLVYVDPPTFSNSKAMGSRTFDVQRDHVELLIGVSRLLAPGGLALFSCNLRSFKPDEEALARYGVQLVDVSAQSIPHDFARTPRIHRCYEVRRA